MDTYTPYEKTVHVEAYLRDGQLVKAHTRKIKTANPDTPIAYDFSADDYVNPMEKCPGCQITKPSALFREGYCKDCRAAGLNLLPVPRLGSPDAPKRVTKAWLGRHGRKCYKCREIKPLLEFSKDKSKAYGRGSRCLECDADKVRARRCEDHGEIDAPLARKVNALPGDVCYLCDNPLTGPIDLDHVIPLAVGKEAGGINAMSNLAPVHRACNQRKGGRHWDRGGPDTEWEEDLFERMFYRQQELWLMYHHATATPPPFAIPEPPEDWEVQ